MLKSHLLLLSGRSRSRASPRECWRFLSSRNYGSSDRWNRRDIYRDPILEPETESSSPLIVRMVAPMAVLLITGAGLYLHYNDERRATPLGSSKNTASSNTSNRPAIGGAFQLFDMQNHLVTEYNLQGNWVLLFFGYTSSPDICPIELQKMTKVIQILDSEQGLKLTPVFITIDPQRDSPSQLRAYLSEFDSRIIGLTGPIGSVRHIAQEYRVFFKKVDEESRDDYLVESSNHMYLLDPNMEMVKYFGTEYNADQLAEGILNEVKKATAK